MDSDLNLDDVGGTSIDKLQKSDIEINYDKILPVNSISYETREEQIRAVQTKNDLKISKKNINVDKFVRNLELSLDDIDVSSDVDNDKKKQTEKNKDIKTKSLYQQIIEFKYMDIILSVLFFMVLNNIVVIDMINKIPQIGNTNSLYPNLIVRSLLFAGLLFLVKKYL